MLRFPVGLFPSTVDLCASISPIAMGKHWYLGALFFTRGLRVCTVIGSRTRWFAYISPGDWRGEFCREVIVRRVAFELPALAL